MRKFWVVVTAFAGGLAIAQPKPAPPVDPLVDGVLKGPEAELGTAKVTMPPLPSFDLPAPDADGARSTKELRVKGTQFLGREITVKGFVTWAYDCIADVRKPGMTDKATQALIDADPTLCERAKFYIGDAKTMRREISLWVVDVPRPYTKLDIKRIKKPDRTDPLKCEPNETDPKKQTCPPYKDGDQVEVTGTFELTSPHNERNSDGLLIFKSMKNVTKRWQSPNWARATPWNPPQSPPSSMPPMPAMPKPRMVERVPKSVFEESKRIANEGTLAYGQRQWDVAIDRYTKATLRWKGNHSAWYGLAAAHGQKREWAKSADAAWGATVGHPTNAMYRLMHGRALYEKAIAQAKQDQARRENKPVDQIEVDLRAVNFEKALLELQIAVVLDSKLWRSHYLIGSIHRHAGRTKESAAEVSKALELGPIEPAPFIALAELYRAWDYPDLAIQVAEQGTAAVVGSIPQSDVWFEVAMAYDDKRLDDKAIDAFTKSLAAHADNHKAKFGRGQAYYRKRAYDKAKVDLEEFSKHAGPVMEFFKVQASRILMDIAAKQASPKR